MEVPSREYLIKEITRINSADYIDIMKECKQEEIINKRNNFKETDSYYKNIVFNPKSLKEIEKLDPELIIINDSDNEDVKSKGIKNKTTAIRIWNFFKVFVSSFNGEPGKGRSIRILIRDRTSLKYIGIASIKSDFLTLPARDNFIGWEDEKTKRNTVQYIWNINTCVPLQPFGYNFNGGKLITSLIFTKEVYNMISRKFKTNNKVAAFTTTSLYGKGIMYDRLPFLKFIGYTNGTGMQIPDELYNKCMVFLKNRDGKEAIKKFDKQSSSKRNKMRRVCTLLGINPNLVYNNVKRGVYFGYTSPESRDFLHGKISEKDFRVHMHLKTVKEMTIWWKSRWAEQRYNNLLQKNLIQSEILFNQVDKKLLHAYNVKKSRENKKTQKTIDEETVNKLVFDTKEINNNKTIFKLDNGLELREGYGEIYMITNKINNKKYIGQTQQVYGRQVRTKQPAGYKRRWFCHIKSANRMKKKKDNNNLEEGQKYCLVLNNAIIKYGVDNFIVEPLIVCPVEFLNKYEIELIKRYDTLTPNGYNMTQGGGGQKKNTPRKLSNKHKQRISQSNKGKLRKLEDNFIINILEMKSDPTMNIIKVEEEYGLQHQTVSEIWNGKYLPLDETLITDYHKNLINLNRQYSNTKKRSVNDDEIRLIRNLIKEGKNSTEIGKVIILEKTGKPPSKQLVSAIRKNNMIPTDEIKF